MTNRAHHPAERGSGEFASDASTTLAASGEPEASGAEDAVSREVVLSPQAERVLARRGDGEEGAEEVGSEPGAGDDPRVTPASDGNGGAASEGAVDAVSEAVPEPVSDATPAPPGASPNVPAPASQVSAGQEASPSADAAVLQALHGAAPDEPAAPPLPVAPALEPAAPSAPAEGTSDEPRRASHPPPFAPALSARELEPPRGAFTGPSPAEVTAAELESAAGADAAGAEGARASGEERPSFRAPWVDEVPDPVTPYEQRVSETVKVADLPPVEQLRGRVLANRYLAEEVAEHTACSISYRAYHLALDRAVTVRVLLRGLACADDVCKDVRRIAAAATALEHAHVASTLDFGVLSDGWPFVVTEHFPGYTLATLSSKEGKFVLRRVLHVGKQLAQGLSAAHERGLVHGLLSPDNVLVVDPGSSAEVAKILGFGISKARGLQPGPPRRGVFGVPFYVSPEQAACRPIDERSDIYSLGVILYELMTGSPPFSDGDFAGVLCQHLDDDAPSPSTRLSSSGALAKALDAIIARCLQKEPEQRYQKASELADDLLRLEAAAARTKRRPMPEVQKPTTTIHSPHPKAEAPEVPGAKVIVHDDLDDVGSPQPPEAAARRSSAAATARPSGAPADTAAGNAATPRAPGVTGAGARRPSQPPALAGGRAPRIRVDQATIKISAVDRERLLAERDGGRGSWVASVVAALRRLITTEPGGSNDDTR